MLNLYRQNQLREQYRQMNPAWRPATEVYAALARSYIDAHSRILDLGCGRGGLVEQLDLPRPQVTGIDPDLQSLENHRLDMIDRVAASSDCLPLRDGSYDLILASWLFEHLQNPAKTMNQVSRILKPGGAVVFITPNGRHPVAYLNRLLGRLTGVQRVIVRGFYGREPEDTFPTQYLANTEEQVETLARQSGLVPVTLMTIADPTYLAFSPRLFRLASMLEDSLPPSARIHLVGVLKRPG